MKVVCPFCDIDASLVKGDMIYPHRPDLYNLNYWMCKCGAYVGCHKPNELAGFDGTEPLGTLADKGLRITRLEAHNKFDEIWQVGYMTRTEAYQSLARYLMIPDVNCHIGLFNISQCSQVLKYVNEFWISLSQ